MTAQTQNEPPADIFIEIDHAKPEKDTAWYSSGDVNTMTTGDNRVVENIPRLVGRTEGGRSGASPSTPSAYDWRTNASRGYSASPYGLPRQGDTYTWDGDTYHTVGDPPILQPIELLTRWLERLPG